MNILCAVNAANCRTAGMARHTHAIRDELVKMGHRVDLVFADDVPAPFRSRRLAALLFPLLMLIPLWRLSRRNGGYDVVSIHTLEGAVYVGLRRLFRRLPRCVILSYGADELRWELEKEEDRLGLRKLGLRARLLYYNLMVRPSRFATRHADHVNTAARSEKRFFETVYGIPPERVTVIPNGVAEEFFAPREDGRPPARLLFLGGWEWRKGTRYLVEAFSNVAAARPDATLSLVGTGAGEADVKAAFPARLRGRLSVVPRVEAKELPRVYADHDIFVFPSLFESMSLVVPEAMASGMPIVTTRACGMQDVIEDGVSGLLVPPRDAGALAERVRRLLGDPGLCARLGRAAREKAREIAWERIAARTLELYERVLAAP